MTGRSRPAPRHRQKGFASVATLCGLVRPGQIARLLAVKEDTVMPSTIVPATAAERATRIASIVCLVPKLYSRTAERK
jgi:hypothetical protein